MFFFSISATTMCQIGFFFSVEQPTRWKPAAIFFNSSLVLLNCYGFKRLGWANLSGRTNREF